MTSDVERRVRSEVARIVFCSTCFAFRCLCDERVRSSAGHACAMRRTSGHDPPPEDADDVLFFSQVGGWSRLGALPLTAQHPAG